VCARVHTKTHFVTAASNSKRLFGTGRNTKGINGTVQEVVVDRSGKVAKSSLSVTWELAGEEKERTFSLRSTQAGDAPQIPGTASGLTIPMHSLAVGCKCQQDVHVRWQGESPYSEQLLPTPPSLAPPTPQGPSVINVHGLEWTEEEFLRPFGGGAPRIPWGAKTLMTDIIKEGGDAIGSAKGTPYVYFMSMFPQEQLKIIVELTTEKLEASRL
jgi:hypothetical protein